MYPMPGFWSANELSRPFQCTLPTACPGVSPETLPTGARMTDACAEGYTGTVCALCEDGYHLDGPRWVVVHVCASSCWVMGGDGHCSLFCVHLAQSKALFFFFFKFSTQTSLGVITGILNRAVQTIYCMQILMNPDYKVWRMNPRNQVTADRFKSRAMYRCRPCGLESKER